MNSNILKVIDVYPYKLVRTRIKFLLCLRNTSKVYGGQWRMIGGKIKENETAKDAALRELKEETQLTPKLFWSVPTLNQYFDFKRNVLMHIPVFAAQINEFDKPVLNEEHTEFKWVELDDIEQFNLWPEQLRIIHLIHNQVKKGQIVEDWIVQSE
jgi:dihydroneopterin triphosphate diphosphatase